MAQFVRGIVCQRVITDQATNSVSYIDAIEELQFSSLPAVLPPFIVGTLWERGEEEEELEIRLRFVRPDGKHSHEFTPPKTALIRQRHRVNLTVGGLPVAVEGRHTIVIHQRVGGRWRKVASYPLYVDVLPE